MTHVPGSQADVSRAEFDFRDCTSRQAASVAAAEFIANGLRESMAGSSRSQASLVVSGGSTPGACFDQLSTTPLDWSRVTVLPSDERWLPADQPESNENLIRTRLLTNRAHGGKILPFYREGIEAGQAPSMIERDLEIIALPFSVSLLGMGEDGHFASLFPDFEGLSGALDPGGTAQCITVQTAGSPFVRISLTLSALISSRHLVLLMFGEPKRRVLERAAEGGSQFPVEALLHHARRPLTVFWAA